MCARGDENDCKMSKWFYCSSVRKWLNDILIRLMLSQLVCNWFVSSWSFGISCNQFQIRPTLRDRGYQGSWASFPEHRSYVIQPEWPSLTLWPRSQFQVPETGVRFTMHGPRRQSGSVAAPAAHSHSEWCVGGGRVQELLLHVERFWAVHAPSPAQHALCIRRW